MKNIIVGALICFGLVISQSTIKASAHEENEIYTTAEKQPEYPGGYKDMLLYIFQNIQYPESDLEGRVICEFTVMQDGTIEDIKVVRGLSEAFDNESIRLIKNMQKWTPGEIASKPVNCKVIVPIVFKQAPAFGEEDFAATKRAIKKFYQGGSSKFNRYMKENLQFPTSDKKGDIVCRFSVQQDGSISNVKTIQGLEKSIDEEVVRVIANMPKWKTGDYCGNNSECSFYIAVSIQ